MTEQEQNLLSAFKAWEDSVLPKTEVREDISKEGLERWAAVVRIRVNQIAWKSNWDSFWNKYLEGERKRVHNFEVNYLLSRFYI